MRFPALLILALLMVAHLSEAAPIQTVTTLHELGVIRPARLSGAAPQQDYYLPLPTRDFQPSASRVDVEVSGSPFLSAESVVTLLVNDRAVGIGKIAPGGTTTISAHIPPGTKADDPNNNILKLTVKATLALAGGEVRDHTLATAQSWVDVLPGSAFTCGFDSGDPDWLSVARLPLTLRPRIAVPRPAESAPDQDAFALRLVSWIARSAPRSALLFRRPEPGSATDVFVLDADRAAHPGIEITADGLLRTIHLRARTATDFETLVRTLRSLDFLRLPGSAWVCSSEPAPAATPPVAAVGVETIDPEVTGINRSEGPNSRSLRFERSAIPEATGDIILRLKGRVAVASMPAPLTIGVFLNGRMVSSRRLESGATAFDGNTPLPAEALRGSNELTITIYPEADDTTTLWQLDSASCLRAAAGGSQVEPATDLLEAARQSFSNGGYDVRLRSPSDWNVAASVVAWLQRINPGHHLDPRLVPRLTPGRPAVIVGGLDPAANILPAGSIVPLTFDGGTLTVHSQGVSRTLGVAPGGSAGIWQLSRLDPATPAILADGWGPAAASTLETVSSQLADSIWIESGDVIVGDGVTPPLTFATRERLFAPVSEPTASIPLDAANPAQKPALAEKPHPVVPWRWALIGGLWLLLSAVVLWIFGQTRKHAAL